MKASLNHNAHPIERISKSDHFVSESLLREWMKGPHTAYPFDRFRVYPSRIDNGWMGHLTGQITHAANSSEWALMGKMTEYGPLILGARVSQWDRVHFGYWIASLTVFVMPAKDVIHHLQGLVSRVVAALRESGIRFVSARIGGNDISTIHTLENAGFRYYETLVWTLRSCSQEDANPVEGVRMMRDEDMKAVEVIAKNYNYPMGHFQLDKGFESGVVESLYHKWFLSSVEAGDPIIVVENEGAPAGFYLLKLYPDLSRHLGGNYGSLSTVAIDSRIRGRGLGKKLFQGSVAHLASLGVEYIDACFSSKNHPSAALFAATGFRPIHEMITLHYWL